jgi:hypothetical protein
MGFKHHEFAKEMWDHLQGDIFRTATLFAYPNKGLHELQQNEMSIEDSSALTSKGLVGGALMGIGITT